MEEWRNVKGFEGVYKVSSLGRIMSIERFVKHSKGGVRKVRERILKQSLSKGYLRVKIGRVHNFMAISFLGHNPDGTNKIVVDHIDGDKLNNNLSNLQLITNRENGSKDRKGYTSEFVGVYKRKDSKKFYSCIQIEGRNINLGAFNSEIEASNAYQNKLLAL